MIKSILISDGNNQELLSNALHYFHVAELRSLCSDLKLADKGAKGVLIERVMHFVRTGEKLALAKIPLTSCAKKGELYPLKPATHMLKGAYKNDLETRLFFKKLIGEHFHFTAFGIDWLNARWMQGLPPTYQEFATMWVQESARRAQEGSEPKKEWAFINFTQKALKEDPLLSKERLLSLWSLERENQVYLAKAIILKIKAPSHD